MTEKANAKNTGSTSNYNADTVKYMKEVYEYNPTRATVETLADELGKSTRSIIAKLSREGVYIPVPRTTKKGTPVVAKATLVETIEKMLKVSVPSLSKAGKGDLHKIVDSLNECLHAG